MALSQAAISTAFQNVLQRAPSASELNSYFAASQSGALSDSQVYTAIITSPEAAAGTFSVTRFYQAAFGRVPDQAGLDQQVDTYNVNGNNLKAIATGFTQATEFTNRYGTDSTVTVAYLQALYVNVLGRTGSSAEIQNWLNAVATPGSGYANRADVLFGFAQSGEFIQNSNSGVINFLTGAAQGQNVYSGPLPVTGNVGQNLTLTTGIDTLTGTAANDTFRADNTTLQSTDTIRGNGGTDTFSYTDSSAGGVSPAVASVSGVANINLRNINGTPAVAATNEVATATFNAVAQNATVTIAGRTITATGGAATAADVATAFATGANSGNAVVSGALTNYTATAGGTTTSTVFTSTVTGNVTDLTSSGDGAQPAIAIQQGNAGSGASQTQINASSSNFAGATNFNSDNSTGAVAFTDLAAGQTVGVIGNGSTVNGAVSAAYVNGATNAVINAQGGSRGSAVTITGAGLTSATINSTGAANTLGTVSLATGNVATLNINALTNLTLTGVTDTNLRTLNVSGGAASVSVGTLDGGVTTVDASGLSGGLTATLGAGITSFKGGQGNDVVTTTALTSTTAGIINAGAGTDTLVVGTATDLNTAAKGALYTGFETLRVAASQDVSLVSGITAVEVGAATSAVLTGLTAQQAGAITVRGDQGTALTLTLANATGNSDTVSLTLNNPTSTAASLQDVDIAGLSIIGVENLTITSSGGGTNLGDAGTLNSLTFGSGGADKLAAITLNGTSSLDLNLTNTVNAITLTDNLSGSAALKVAGATVGGSVINGTANADEFTLGTTTGTGVVSYVGGAGNDKFFGTAAQLSAGNSIDGGVGTDIVTVSDTSGTVSLVDAAFQRITNVEKFVSAQSTGSFTLTSGGFFDGNYKAAGIEITATSLTSGAATVDLTTFTGKAVVTTGVAASTGAQTITTGSGDDVVTVNGTGTGADFVVSTGAGNDTITINGSATTDTATVTGGAGKDIITFASAIVNASGAAQMTVIVGAGDSTKTAFDSVTGFDLNTTTTGSGLLDFDGTAAVAATFTGSAVTGFTSAELTATNTAGIITFQGSAAAGLTLAQRIEAVDSLINTDNATAAFVFNGNTYVFHDSTVATGDSLVELVGVQATSLITTNANAANAGAAGALYIA